MKKIYFALISIGFLMCLLMGCSSRTQKTSVIPSQTAENEELNSKEDDVPLTKDTAIVISVDTDNQVVRLQSTSTGETMILTYTGGCDVRNKYDEIMSMTQLEPGEIVDFSYVVSKKKMYSLNISDTAWEYKDVRNLVIDELGRTMSIAKDMYQYDNLLVIVSEGEKAMLMDLNAADTLILRGIGKQVCSIVVDKGHGYVKLKNEDYFVGGFVSVGQEAVKPVTKEMMLVVPEGNYNMSISKNGVGGTKSITVTRNEETMVDVGSLRGAQIEQGGVKFNISPKEARLYIDGVKTNHEELITLAYGSHKVLITASGYESYSGTLQVREILKELDIELEAADDNNHTPTPTPTKKPTVTPEADATLTPGASATPKATVTPKGKVTPQVTIITPGDEGSDTTISDEASEDEEIPNSQATSNGSSKIYITAPSGAEVYLDGNYMGLAPISFAKQSGTHTITLRREGYKTKSYTVYVPDDSEDTTYTFSDMVANDD